LPRISASVIDAYYSTCIYSRLLCYFVMCMWSATYLALSFDFFFAIAISRELANWIKENQFCFYFRLTSFAVTTDRNLSFLRNFWRYNFTCFSIETQIIWYWLLVDYFGFNVFGECYYKNCITRNKLEFTKRMRFRSIDRIRRGFLFASYETMVNIRNISPCPTPDSCNIDPTQNFKER